VAAPEPGLLLRRFAMAPGAIEALSIERLQAEAGALPWVGDEARLALRLAYAVGDPSILSDLEIASGAIEHGVEALGAGQALLTEVRMVVSGVDRAMAEAVGVDVRCLLDATGVAEAARARGITRSAQAVLEHAGQLSGAVVAIGNAPTALLALLDLIDAGLTRPALILGFPVGYVAAAESKEELRQRDVPYVTLRGHRGGTPLAVSAINTLLRIVAERTAGIPRARSRPDAILLVGHGSREPEAARAMERVMVEMAARGPIDIVEPGFVQLTAPTIPEGVGRCVLQGARNIVAVPYFLHEGKHVLRDLPALLRQATEQYPGTRICLATPIGSHSGLTDIALERALRGPFIGDILESADDLGAAEYVMSSAPLTYLEDGRPDWNRMWQSFCELALFGGPPHRGADDPVRGIAPSASEPVEDDPIDELRRGIYETTGLLSESAEPGWLAVACANERMAAWMCATIILENVDARASGNLLYVPVRPSFTIDDEVKSVVTVVAKTHHYWASGHLPSRPVPMRDRGSLL
jgi:precorrin isomerase